MRFMARRLKIRGLVRGQKGVALVEILVAIAILGVVAVAFLSALTTAYGAVIVADRHTKAESLTRTAFEYMRNASYDDCDNPIKAFPAEWVPDATSGYPYGLDANYEVQVISSLLSDNSTRPVKKITVVILYRGTAVDTTTTYRSDPNRGL